jgi:tripartite-type tricarboxylate transporter receptor subunit TctC
MPSRIALYSAVGRDITRYEVDADAATLTRRETIRALAKLTDVWGQQVVADNRPGANGLIACEIEARAAPDGYTLLMANIATHAISPALYKKIPFDPMIDHVPVALLGTTANVLVVPSSTS